jgi:hypothetical protein
MTASGKWDDDHDEVFPWQREYRTQEWLDHIQTHSDHRGLPPERLEVLLAGIGAEIELLGASFVMQYETALVTGVKRE